MSACEAPSRLLGKLFISDGNLEKVRIKNATLRGKSGNRETFIKFWVSLAHVCQSTKERKKSVTLILIQMTEQDENTRMEKESTNSDTRRITLIVSSRPAVGVEGMMTVLVGFGGVVFDIGTLRTHLAEALLCCGIN